MKKLRVYVTANNLAVFTKYSGYDPEVNARRTIPSHPVLIILLIQEAGCICLVLMLLFN